MQRDPRFAALGNAPDGQESRVATATRRLSRGTEEPETRPPATHVSGTQPDDEENSAESGQDEEYCGPHPSELDMASLLDLFTTGAGVRDVQVGDPFFS